MKYDYREGIELIEKPSIEWNKNTDKEILQYAVGGLLYMPATNVKIVDDILNKRFYYLKAFILCLEDSIADSMVEKAEECVGIILEKISKAIKDKKIKVEELPLIFIRVRECGQMAKLYKMFGQNFDVLTGFIWPKFDKSNGEKYVSEFKEILSKINFKMYGMPILESESVMHKTTRMENLLYIRNAIKPISDNILGIRVGGADLCNLFGVRRNADYNIWDIKVVANCFADIINEFEKDYVISGPIWEYFKDEENENWRIGLEKEIELDFINGMIGKDAIHPTQLPVIQEASIISYENYKDALSILNMKEDVGVEKGFGCAKMNEVKTHSKWAKKIINLSRIYGVKK